MTIFNGGTFGPVLPKLSPLLFSSVSASLSALHLAAFGLGHGLFRSSAAETFAESDSDLVTVDAAAAAADAVCPPLFEVLS